jgi:hypothetical protein
MVAELYDEDAAYDGGIDGIGEHRATITKPRRLVHEQRQDLGHRGNLRARAIGGARGKDPLRVARDRASALHGD